MTLLPRSYPTRFGMNPTLVRYHLGKPIIGTTWVRPKETGPDGLTLGAPVQAYIRSDDHEFFVMTRDNTLLGHHGLSQITGYPYGDYEPGSELFQSRTAVTLSIATGRKHYADIGTRFHQITVEQSLLNGHEGRAELTANRGTAGFHFKCGFRTQVASGARSPEQKQAESMAKDAQIADEIARTGVCKLGGSMYLPQSRIAIWKAIISKQPILRAIQAQYAQLGLQPDQPDPRSLADLFKALRTL